MSDKAAAPDKSSPRADSIWASLVLGLPLSAAVLAFLHQPRFDGTRVQRYISHPIETVEVVVFCCAIAALVAKLWGCLRQRRALRCNVLPEWDGERQPPGEAQPLFARLAGLPRSVRRSWIGQRCRAVLDYLCRRSSAAGLDDHVRVLADNDAMALESSYSFIRFLVWATPILGFLGTVLGITEAIAGVSPEQLEKDLTNVTGGLATAFDTTGLALMLTMITMLVTFLVERIEQRTMHEVDAYVDENLFHRFAHPESDNSPLLATMGQLVERQADVWAESLARMQDRLRLEEQRVQERLTAALAAALEQSLAAHEKQLAEALKPIATLAGALRQQVVSLRPMAEGMAALSQALGRLQEGEGQLVRLQTLLQHNLATLAAAGSFEEALHSLTAAVHLLTARSGMNSSHRSAA